MHYNNERPPTGKHCFGKTPMQTFEDSLHIAKDKNIGEVVHLNPAPIKLKENEHVVRSNKDIVSIPTALINKGNKNITTISSKVKSKLPLLNPYNLAKYIIGQHSTKILGNIENKTKIGRN